MTIFDFAQLLIAGLFLFIIIPHGGRAIANIIKLNKINSYGVYKRLYKHLR